MSEYEEAIGNVQDLTFGQAVVRGARLRCPACGRGRLFRNHFAMDADCSNCRFRFERSPGYFLGSTYINYGITALTTTICFVALRFGVGVEKEVLLPGLLLFCLIFPLVFFRFARSMWLSMDCFFDRVGALEAMPSSHDSKSGSELADKCD